MRRNPIALLGAIGALALLAIAAVIVLMQRTGDDPIDTSIAWYVNPAIASEVDPVKLRETVRETADEALGVRLTLVDLDRSILEQLRTHGETVAREEGLEAAQQRGAALARQEATAPAEADALLVELQRADQQASEAAARVRQRLATSHPAIAIPGGAIGAIELTPASGYGAKRVLPSEPWLVVPAGSAFTLYADDPDRLHQAIANQIVQALAVLAAVPLREAAPDEAMAVSVDTDGKAHLARDDDPVRFNSTEKQTVRRFLSGK